MSRCEDRKKGFIFFKLVRISIHTQFARDTVLEYRIMPTDLPTVLLTNTHNSMLNHEFVLEM
jgi:hypothetical protein